MNVFFDVQGTLVRSGVARPLVRDVFQTVVDEGHHIYIWSSAGSEYAKRAAELLGVDDIVSGYFTKAEIPPVKIHFTVDDHPAMVGIFSEGYLIKPYDGDPEDIDLLKALREIRKAAEKGRE